MGNENENPEMEEEFVPEIEDPQDESPVEELEESLYKLSREEIEKRFGATLLSTFPTAKDFQHEDLRLRFKEFAWTINQLVPEGRLKSLMLTDLESASMWAHKAVAND